MLGKIPAGDLRSASNYKFQKLFSKNIFPFFHGEKIIDNKKCKNYIKTAAISTS